MIIIRLMMENNMRGFSWNVVNAKISFYFE